uniref:Uncharacterized protein n=1 Tax=Chrysemys picta bellii TaxID=8478 RepID=A0A8C3I3X2_CHRPI
MGEGERSSCLLLYNFSVFLSANNANQVISRHKRGSFLIIEEFFQGNLERECLEERCTYEEAREVFEDHEDTKYLFWNKGIDSDPCSSNPCQHDGVCQDSIRSYTCTCMDAYEGPNCNFGKATFPLEATVETIWTSCRQSILFVLC